MDIQIGEVISHYRIIEKLGGGGMGVVYKAEDTKLKRTVALKFLPPELTRDEEAKERFIREAQAASALDHPNICTIYEINETEDGQMFIAMAFYKGETLKNKIARGPLPVEEAVDIAIQTARGLAKAHEGEIVHRDIKPANVMVTNESVVKILDFGLAKIAADSMLTKEGTTLGTFAYMSPEQARGETVDHRTDIWSLGAVMYELLTGQRSSRGEYEQAIVYSIMNVDPEPITNLQSNVPMELEQVVLKSLKKEPAERYQQVEEVLTELNAIRGTEAPSSSVQQPMTAQAVPSKRRWMMVTALFILVLVVGTAILYFRNGGPVPPSEKKMLVVLPFENLGSPEDEYFADGITEEITVRLAGIKELGVIARTSAIQYNNSDKTIQQVGEELGVEYILEGTVRWQRLSEGQSQVRVTPQLIRVSDATHVWANIYDKDIADIFEVQSDIAEQVAKGLGIALLEPERRALKARPTNNIEAYNYYLRGNQYYNRGRTEKDRRNALQMYQKAVDLDSNLALAHARSSNTHTSLYWLDDDRTEKRLSEAKESVDRALRLNPDLPEAHLASGIFNYRVKLDYDRALEQLDIALKGQPNNPEIFAHIGYVKRRQGNFKQAIENIKKASEIDPLNGEYVFNLGSIYAVIRNYPEAERYYNSAISLSPDSPNSITNKTQLYLLWEGRTAKARAVLEGASKNVDLADDPSFVSTWVLLDVFDGNYQEALARLSLSSVETFRSQSYFIPKALLHAQINGLMGNQQFEQAYYDSARIILETRVKRRSREARYHSSLGIAYAGLGRKEDAVREGKEAVNLLPVTNDAWRGPYRVEDLAAIYAMVGEHDAAVEQLEYLLSIPSHISVPLLRLDPKWNVLRDNPRFQRLLKRRK